MLTFATFVWIRLFGFSLLGGFDGVDVSVGGVVVATGGVVVAAGGVVIATGGVVVAGGGFSSSFFLILLLVYL